jgi:hypothetical protein
MHICHQGGFEPGITKKTYFPDTPEPNNGIHVYDLIKAFKLT